MSNPFEELDDYQEDIVVPKRIKKDVKDTYAILDTTLKTVELFVGNTSKAVVAVVKFLSIYFEQKDKDNPKQQANNN